MNMTTFFLELEKHQEEQRKNENRAELLYYLRNQKLLPYILDNKLKILSINIKQDFDYEYLNKRYTTVFREKYLSTLFGTELIRQQNSSKVKTFDVIDRIIKTEFLSRNRNDIKKMQSELYKMGIVNIDKLEDMINSYYEIINIIQYKEFSKLYMLMNICKEQFNLNLVANSLCQFFSKNYSEHNLYMEMYDCNDYIKAVNCANFTDLELNLNKEDKLAELQKLYLAFDIDTIFEKDIYKLNVNDILILPNINIKKDEILEYLIDIAKLNSSIIEDESFYQIYSAITDHSQIKKYIKQ